MTDSGATRIDVGTCSSCGRTLRMKPSGLRQSMRLTCKCGHVNNLEIDQATLSKYGAIRTPVEVNIDEANTVPLDRLLDGPRLRAAQAERDAKWAELWKGLPPESRRPPADIINALVTLYWSEQNARTAMRTLVDRLRTMDRARPWSVELLKTGAGAMTDAPYYVILGATEIGCSYKDTWNAIKQITRDLRSDNPYAAGGEWEFLSRPQADQWRSRALLLERWVFLDANDVKNFGAQPFAA
jgi:hypothetical protein